MAFDNGESIGGADTAQELLDLLVDMLDDHLAWSLETALGNGVQWWKNSGVYNGTGKDFFVAIQKVNTTDLKFFVAETYSVANNTVSYPAINSLGSAPYTLDNFAGLPGPYAHNDSLFGVPNGSRIANHSVTTDPNGYLYALCVTNSTLFIATRVGVTTGVLLGLYDPFSEDSDRNFPLFICDVMNSSTGASGSCLLSRHPGRQNTVNSSNCRAQGFGSNITGNNVWTQIYGTLGDSGTYDIITESPVGSRKPVVVAGAASTFGSFFGLYPHVLGFQSPPGAILNDTILVDGELFVCINGNWWINTEAA